MVSSLRALGEDVERFSFGKFLEVTFYNGSAEMACGHKMRDDTVLFFGKGQVAARFTWQPVKAYGVYVRRHLTFDAEFHRQDR